MRNRWMVAMIATTGLLAGCAGDTAGLTTSSLAPAGSAPATTAAKVDPNCVTLMSRIDAIRKEGVVDRVEKVATAGKSSTVAVKRDSLAKLTELDKANAEYQAKCSTITPGATTAQPKTATGANAVAASAQSAAPKAP